MPGDLVPYLGNLPEWIGVPASIAALRGVGIRREKSAKRWAEIFEELIGISPDELRSFLENHDQQAELFAEALDAGARAVDDEKRRSLARAAAAGIRGDENVKLDDLPLFVRSLDVVEAPHMKLLLLMATKTNDAWSEDSLSKAWPGAEDSLDPLLALLVREGLVRLRTLPTGFDGGVAVNLWDLSQYGGRFTHFVTSPS